MVYECNNSNSLIIIVILFCTNCGFYEFIKNSPTFTAKFSNIIKSLKEVLLLLVLFQVSYIDAEEMQNC